MKFIEYISNIAIPFSILFIICYGVFEKKKVFDLFLDGTKEGVQIVYSIFPTLIGLFFAINLLRSSGVIDFITCFLEPVLNFLNIPKEVLPLMLIRPISGSGAIAVGTDIMKTFGVDSNIGIIAAVIMGSTETTLYTIAVYSSSVKIKNTRFVLWAALIADIVGMLVSVLICQIMSMKSS